MKTPTKQPVAKGGTPLPAGAHDVPGSRKTEANKGAPIKSPVVIDHKKATDPRGGPEMQARHGVRVKDNRTISKR
jgi:hypothetical protein